MKDVLIVPEGLRGPLVVQRVNFASTLLEDAIKRGRIGAMIAASDRAARRCLQRLHRAGRIRPTKSRRGWVLR